MFTLRSIQCPNARRDASLGGKETIVCYPAVVEPGTANTTTINPLSPALKHGLQVPADLSKNDEIVKLRNPEEEQRLAVAERYLDTHYEGILGTQKSFVAKLSKKGRSTFPRTTRENLRIGTKLVNLVKVGGVVRTIHVQVPSVNSSVPPIIEFHCPKIIEARLLVTDPRDNTDHHYHHEEHNVKDESDYFDFPSPIKFNRNHRVKSVNGAADYFELSSPTEPISDRRKETNVKDDEDDFEIRGPMKPSSDHREENTVDDDDDDYFELSSPTEPISDRRKETNVKDDEDDFEIRGPVKLSSDHREENTVDDDDADYFELSSHTEPISDHRKETNVKDDEDDFEIRGPMKPSSDHREENTVDDDDDDYFELFADGCGDDL